MKKWTLRPDPSPHDRDRHVLLIQGEMRHISKIVKKFGAMCGRPLKTEHPEGFNFSIHLHHLTRAGLDKVSGYLAEIAPGAQAGQPALTPPVPAASVLPEAPADAPSLAPVPPDSSPAAQTSPVSIPAPETTAAVSASEAKPLWGLRSPPRLQLTFESLLVGAYNRFAHAAATSVVGAPGTMYNPLFIYGAPGAGKTHLLHAIAAAFKKNWDERAVLMTTGATLANAVSRALAQGRMAEALRALKADAQTASIPVIVLSNLSQEHDRDATLAAGAIAHLVKANISLENLVTTVDRALAGTA